MKTNRILILLLTTITLCTTSMFSFAQSEELLYLLGTNGKEIKLEYETKKKVTTEDIIYVLQTAKIAVEDEKTKRSEGLKDTNLFEYELDEITYTYITFDEEVTYLYEESESDNPKLIIFDSVVQEVSEEGIDYNFNAKVGQTDFIPDGVGGKQTITKASSGSSYLSATMQLPTDSQISKDVENHIHYNYGGFEYSSGASGGVGSWATDAGVMFSKSLGPGGRYTGWKPILTVKKKTTSSSWTTYAPAFLQGYNQVQYRNGFKPGTSPIMYVWFNNNGKIRLKIEGITICANSSGTTLKDTYNIAIYETKSKTNISSIHRWKLLSSVVSPNNTGKNKAVFSNIKIGGAVVSNSYFAVPQQDHANVSRTGNTVTITVNSDLYK